MNELQKLKNWLDNERAIYERTKHNLTDQAKIEEIIRQIAFRDVMRQILKFELEATNEVINSWSNPQN